jgi:septum formation protein
MMQNALKLILASTSPRRRELIKLFGLDFQFASVEVDESPRVGEPARALVERLSRAKAAPASRANRDAIIIAADTVVELDGEIIGKPKDLRDAERMLTQLRGRDHLVYTGLCAMQGAQQHLHCNTHSAVQVWTQTAQTTVTMRHYADAQIAAYVATGDPLDKAAAYAIQHNGFRPVGKIGGCYANVMGLPLCHLYLALKKFDVVVDKPDRMCQNYLKIDCPVARKILRSEI